MKCAYCNREIDVEDGDFSQEAFKKVAFHVWQFHDETQWGISLKDTLANGPSLSICDAGEEE